MRREGGMGCFSLPGQLYMMHITCLTFNFTGIKGGGGSLWRERERRNGGFSLLQLCTIVTRCSLFAIQGSEVMVACEGKGGRKNGGFSLLHTVHNCNQRCSLFPLLLLCTTNQVFHLYCTWPQLQPGMYSLLATVHNTTNQTRYSFFAIQGGPRWWQDVKERERMTGGSFLHLCTTRSSSLCFNGIKHRVSGEGDTFFL